MKTQRSFVLASAIATMVVGLVGMPAAHADGTITVTPATSIPDGSDVTVQVDSFPHDPLASLEIAECGNAYANLAPLPARPTVTFGVLDTRDCKYIGFLSQGTMNTSPVNVAGLTDADPTVRQTGIGTGNRSCIPSPPAVAPCFIYVSTSVNLPSFPSTDITFANANPASSDPAVTTTTVTPIGSPVAVGKLVHALVSVSTADPALKPDGTVHVFEGATELGSADLGADGTVSVPIGSPTLAGSPHSLTATYEGNGSFAGSATGSASTLQIVPVNNISVGDASIIEGDSRVLRNITFPVILSKIPSTQVLVNYSVVGTGLNPPNIGLANLPTTQVVAQAKTLTFKQGQTVKYVTVKLYGNTTVQGDQTFAVRLALNPFDTSGYALRKPDGNGLIIDDDSPSSSGPVVSIGSASVPEGDTGAPRSMKFSVTLSTAITTGTLTVPVQISSGTAVHGSKTNGDWSGGINRKLVFRPGQVTKVIAVSAFPDINSELDLTVKAKILTITSTGTPVVVGSHSEVVGTILSDE